MPGSASVETRIPTQDLARARRWYAEKLGLEPVEERDGGLRYEMSAGVFCLFASAGSSDGSFTQMGFYVDDIEATTVAGLKARGVVFEDYPSCIDSIMDIEGNYPSKGSGERGAWFRDSEGNLLGVGQVVALAGPDWAHPVIGETVICRRRYRASMDAKLDRDQVPDGLEALVPLAEQWGIGDDFERSAAVEAATLSELLTLSIPSTPSPTSCSMAGLLALRRITRGRRASTSRLPT